MIYTRRSRALRALALLAAVATMLPVGQPRAKVADCQSGPSAQACCGSDSCCGCCSAPGECPTEPEPLVLSVEPPHPLDLGLAPSPCTCAVERAPASPPGRRGSETTRLRLIALDNLLAPVILSDRWRFGFAGNANSQRWSMTAAERCHWLSRLTL